MIINRYTAWVWMLFFSFAYEKPVLIISSLDKANPRLFDIVLVVGVLLTLTKSNKNKNPILSQWFYIVLWFSFVALAGIALYPFTMDINKMMLYFLLEYYKGLIAIWVFLKIPKQYYSINTIVSALIVGGVFVAGYCIFEFILGSDEVIVSDTKTIMKPAGLVWGPYIGSYFEIAVFLPVAISVTLVKTLHSKRKYKIWLLLTTLFISWPILFTGSRTAVFLAVFCFSIIVLYSFKKSIWLLLFVSVLLIGTFIFTSRLNFIIDSEQNAGLARIESLEKIGSRGSVESRIFGFLSFDLSSYDQAKFLPFIGGGFYVAPTNGNYRIGYGFHNIYIFPFEQAGLVGVILFLIFIIKSFKILRRGLRQLDKNDITYWFVLSVYAYFLSSLIIGMSGHTFWYGFTTYNFNTLRILLLVVSAIVIIDYDKSKKKIISTN